MNKKSRMKQIVDFVHLTEMNFSIAPSTQINQSGLRKLSKIVNRWLREETDSSLLAALIEAKKWHQFLWTFICYDLFIFSHIWVVCI